MKIFSKTAYLLKEGVKSIFTHGFMSFASASIILACLVIMGSFALLSYNISSIIGDLEKENQIIAFVDENLSEYFARALEADILSVSNVEHVEFVTKEEAYENFAREVEGQASFEGLDADTFRHRYIIYVTNIEETAQTAAAVQRVEGIAEVSTHLDVVRGFIRARDIINVITLVLAAILFVVSVFIMTNTIKLATFVRREEIAIMKMVGANNAFIRFPFVVEGLLLGGIGSGLAFMVEWGLYKLVIEQVAGSTASQLVTMVPFAVFQLPMLVAYLGVGVFVGVFGSLIAIRNYLKV